MWLIPLLNVNLFIARLKMKQSNAAKNKPLKVIIHNGFKIMPPDIIVYVLVQISKCPPTIILIAVFIYLK